MKKIKVAMLCEIPLNGIAYTGSKIYEDKLTYHLSRRRDIELHIIAIGKENKQFKKDNLITHTVKKRKYISIPYFRHLLIWKIKYKIVKINPNIVHAISTGFPYSTVAVSIRGKYPTVLTAYGIAAKEIEYYKEDYKKIQKIRFSINSSISILNERYVLSKIPNIVVQTPSIKNIISKWTKSKIYVVPSGIEYGEIKKMQLHTLLNERPDIFIVNNLQKLKGTDILIEAIPVVMKSISNLNVYIAGSGPQENELKALVKKLNLEAHVKFLGFISKKEKYQYYKACKIVVVPSRWDCQPFALLDAAASGKPVVASRIGGIPDTVEDGKTGFLFEPANVEDLAEKIITLLKDEELREEMGRAANERAKSYDWKKIAERTVEIYKEVIADFHERS